MTSRFDDDDLEDYAQGDYSDEEDFDYQKDISPEEEAAMYELAPLVSSQLKDYTGFADDDVLRALYNNYNVLDDAVAEMKSKWQLTHPHIEIQHS